MEKNKTGKYLKYAIGEIVLVAIGILIALQVNNWNNKRIEYQLEIQILNEIANNLNSDLNQIEGVLEFNRKKDSVITKVFKIMSASENLNRTKMMTPLIPILAEYEVFLSNRVAFDNMVSSFNINLISDDQLRQKLSTYYKNTDNLADFTQEQIKNQTRKFVDENVTMLLNDELAKTLTGENIIINQNDDFFTNPRSFKNLFNMRINMSSQNNLLNYFKSQINLIQEDLKK